MSIESVGTVTEFGRAGDGLAGHQDAITLEITFSSFSVQSQRGGKKQLYNFRNANKDDESSINP